MRRKPCISPPALSIFLGNLEERTGTRFFDRIGKQFVPTEAGKIYLEHAKEMIKIEAHYENELQKYMGGSSGTIRFGIHPRRTLYLLAKALPVFFRPLSGREAGPIRGIY